MVQRFAKQMMCSVKTNNFGRQFVSGKSLSHDLKLLIIGEMRDMGANKITGEVPRGTYTRVAEKFKIHKSTVSDLWQKEVNGHIPGPKRSKTAYFNDGDLELMETLLRDKPTLTYRQLGEKLQEFSTFDKTVPKQRISYAVRHKLPSGQRTFKKVSRKPGDRFNDHNMRYTQAYITYVGGLNPRKLKFFDECGVKVTNCNRTYCHGLKGKTTFEIGKYINGANLTLNMMISLDGILFFNFIDGASTTDTFAEFWHQAVHSLTPDGSPTLENGDIVIVDNCAINKNAGETRTTALLGPMGVEYMFLPTYSPDLNPIENCFGQLKKLMQQERFQRMCCANLKVGIGEALKEISSETIKAYYQYTGYINV